MKTLKKLCRSVLSLTLAGLLAFTGCSSASRSLTSGDLMAGVKPSINKPKLSDTDPDCPAAVTGFGLELLRRSLEAEPEKDTLLSPLSVLEALAMTAAGAQGETLAQMEAAFGADFAPLREFLAAYGDSLPSGKKYSFHQANSLWVKEGEIEVYPDFLQQNADYFGAGMFERPFDEATLEQINGWVNEHTHEMIPEILDKIPEEAVMFLINALAFEAQWKDVYDAESIRDGQDFIKEDGTVSKASMMLSYEDFYMKDNHAQGFLKLYAGEKYAFAALLPDVGFTLTDYLDGLTGEHLRELLTGAKKRGVYAAVPQFKAEYSTSLVDTLRGMGMELAFDPGLADFSGIGQTANGFPLYIDEVLHKTYIEVDAQGTKAAAATVVAVACGASMDAPPQVHLTRPFLYMIVDMENRVPIFMGAMYDPQL